ncbi:hypothetical protein C8F01DRAFT_1232188, partial [Mycena amicta]
MNSQSTPAFQDSVNNMFLAHPLDEMSFDANYSPESSPDTNGHEDRNTAISVFNYLGGDTLESRGVWANNALLGSSCGKPISDPFNLGSRDFDLGLWPAAIDAYYQQEPEPNIGQTTGFPHNFPAGLSTSPSSFPERYDPSMYSEINMRHIPPSPHFLNNYHPAIQGHSADQESTYTQQPQWNNRRPVKSSKAKKLLPAGHMIDCTYDQTTRPARSRIRVHRNTATSLKALNTKLAGAPLAQDTLFVRAAGNTNTTLPALVDSINSSDTSSALAVQDITETCISPNLKCGQALPGSGSVQVADMDIIGWPPAQSAQTKNSEQSFGGYSVDTQKVQAASKSNNMRPPVMPADFIHALVTGSSLAVPDTTETFINP